MAEPDALGGALDQPRNVGDDELAAVRRVDRAEHRLERRERVVGDLRLRVGDARAGATTCRRSAGRRARRRRAASGAARARPPRRAGRSLRTAESASVDVAKRRLPRPPAPPRQTTARAPGCARSAMRCPSPSNTCVPTGRAARRRRRSRRACRLRARARRVPPRTCAWSETPRGRGGRGRRRARRHRRGRRRRRRGRPWARASRAGS